MKIELGKAIGDGRFADIWQGIDEIGRDVAVKVLREEGKDVSTILDHAKALVRSKHKNVVDVYAIEVIYIPSIGDEKCIVMEHIKGITLRERLKRSLTNKEAYRIGHEILQGVTHIHEQGLVHMDLHDENVLIESDGNVKLIDIMYLSSLRDAPEKTQDSRLKHDKVQLISILSDICLNSPLGDDARREFKNNISEKSPLQEIAQSFEDVYTLIRLGLEYVINTFHINGVTARHYRFRSECAHDVEEFRKLMGKNTISIQTSSQLFPDNDVELVTALGLEEVRDIMGQIEDGHVMYQTLQPYYLYTGERNFNIRY